MLVHRQGSLYFVYPYEAQYSTSSAAVCQSRN